MGQPLTTKGEDMAFFFFLTPRKTSTLTQREDEFKDMNSKLGSLSWALWAWMKLSEKGEVEESTQHEMVLLSVWP